MDRKYRKRIEIHYNALEKILVYWFQIDEMMKI